MYTLQHSLNSATNTCVEVTWADYINWCITSSCLAHSFLHFQPSLKAHGEAAHGPLNNKMLTYIAHVHVHVNSYTVYFIFYLRVWWKQSSLIMSRTCKMRLLYFHDYLLDWISMWNLTGIHTHTHTHTPLIFI